MGRALKWSLALVLAAVTFVVCLWSTIMIASRLLPHIAEADRWVAATAFATVMSTAVGLWAAWWAGREKQSEPPLVPHVLQQDITASAPGATAQGAIIGNVYNDGSSEGADRSDTRPSAIDGTADSQT